MKISSNIRNFTNVTQYIPTVCWSQLKYNLNKNCLGSFQVLWNKNYTTMNEEIMMKKKILNVIKETNKISCKK
jgi:hypothetical protein